MQESACSEAPPINSSSKRDAPARNTWTKRLLLWGRIALSLGLLAVLATMVDRQDMWRAFRATPMHIVAIGAAFMLAAQALCGLRLCLLLRTLKIRASVGYCLRVHFAGVFANNFLPTTVGGDSVRFAALTWRGYPLTNCLAAVAADRIINMSAMVALLSTVWLAPGLLSKPVTQGVGLGALAFLVAGLVGVFLAYWRRQALVKAYRGNGRLPESNGDEPEASTSPGKRGWFRSSRIRRLRRRALVVVARWANSPGQLVLALGISLTLILLVHLGLWLVARSLGLELSYPAMVAVCALVTLISMAPVTINGLGLQEAGLVTLLMRMGAATEEALAIAILARFYQLVASVPGTVCLFRLRRERPHDDSVETSLDPA